MLSRDFLKQAVSDYMFYFNRECLELLLVQIRLDTDGFFHLRDPFVSLFETLMIIGSTNVESQLINAVGFLSHLWIRHLNPLVVCYHKDKRVLNLCIRLLQEALNKRLLTREDYLAFYTNAFTHLRSEGNVHSQHIFYLLTSLRFENSTPVSIAIKFFSSELIRQVFLSLSDAHYHFNLLSRDEFYHYLTAPDCYGLTPLHYAFKRKNPIALIDLYASMSLILTREEHIHFHMLGLPNNTYLDWIAFYGTMKKLQSYINFLRDNLRGGEVKTIISGQAQVQHRMRVFYDNESEMSQALIHLVENPEARNCNPSKFLCKFRLFSFPQTNCDGLKTGYDNDKTILEPQRQFNP